MHPPPLQLRWEEDAESILKQQDRITKRLACHPVPKLRDRFRIFLEEVRNESTLMKFLIFHMNQMLKQVQHDTFVQHDAFVQYVARLQQAP